jgi:MFS family permease
MSDPAPSHDPYITWRNRNFRFYAASWFLIVFAKQIETLAVTVYFVDKYDAKNAPLALGLMGLVQALPVMLLAIAGGQIADRFDRRIVWIVACAVNMCASLGLVTVAWLGLPVIWIYVLLGAMAISTALGSPSRAALLPQLVSPETLVNAVTWNSSVFYIGSVTGPVVCGGIMWLSSNHPAPAFALVVVCRLLALVNLAAVRRPKQVDSGAAISWKNVVAGIRFVWNTKLILATITLDLFAVLFGGVTYLLPVFAKHVLHVGPLGLGFLQAADAVGAITMSVLLAHLPPMRRAGVAMLRAVAGFGLAIIVFGLSTWFWLSLLMMFLVGALDNISVVVRHTLVQMLTPDVMRGRVSAVNNVFIVASNDLGGLESGLTAWLFGSAVISVVGGGIGTILVVIGAAFLWPQILSIGSLTAIRPMPVSELDSREEATLSSPGSDS